MKNEFEVREDHVVIFVTWKGVTYDCLIDLADLPKAQSWENLWQYDGEYVFNRKRVGARSDNKAIKTYLHRFITGADDTVLVDHRDGNTLDNRRKNLRHTNKSGNALNQDFSSNNSSGYKNVYYHRATGMWEVKMSGKHYGYYHDKQDAIDVARGERIKRKMLRGIS